MTGPIDLSQKTSPPTSTTIKLLCSYGGKIVPRHPDGKLRYNGGHTRVLAVDRSVSFAELLVKLGEMSGTSTVSLRCQLPNEDMNDALVSITTDEDLANLIEEYDHHHHHHHHHHKQQTDSSNSSSLKIRAFLSPPKSIKKVSPTPSMAADFSPSNHAIKLPQKSTIRPCFQVNNTLAMGSRVCYDKALVKLSRYAYHGPAAAYPGHVYMIHHRNQWQ